MLTFRFITTRSLFFLVGFFLVFITFFLEVFRVCIYCRL